MEKQRELLRDKLDRSASKEGVRATDIIEYNIVLIWIWLIWRLSISLRNARLHSLQTYLLSNICICISHDNGREAVKVWIGETDVCQWALYMVGHVKLKVMYLIRGRSRWIRAKKQCQNLRWNWWTTQIHLVEFPVHCAAKIESSYLKANINNDSILTILSWGTNKTFHRCILIISNTNFRFNRVNVCRRPFCLPFLTFYIWILKSEQTDNWHRYPDYFV